MLRMRLSLCQPLVLSPGPEVHLGFSIVGSQAVRCVLVVCHWVPGCHWTIALGRSVTDLDTSENRNGQGLPPNVARSDAVVLGSLLAQSGWAAKDFGCHRLTGWHWDFLWCGERPSLNRILFRLEVIVHLQRNVVVSCVCGSEEVEDRSGSAKLVPVDGIPKRDCQVICGSGLFRPVCGC